MRRASLQLFCRKLSTHQNKMSDNLMVFDGQFVNIKEGKAEILYKTSKDVFYNPVQEFNRDLSVSVLRLFNYNYIKNAEVKKNAKESVESEIKDSMMDSDEVEVGSMDVEVTRDATRKVLEPGKVYENGVKVLEALAASGLRSVRYAKEVGGIKSIICNDLSTSAVENIKVNVKHNGVEDLVVPNEGDATVIMYHNRKPAAGFDAIDLDPYGSPTPFLDAAVQSVKNGGLLLITATDMGVLCGSAHETCYYKYGSVPFKTKACHEMALRIMLQHVQAHATRYGRYIRPLLSVSVDFYMRTFVQVFTGNRECKRTASDTASGYMCTGCETINLQYLNKCTIDGKNEKFGRRTGPPVGPECKHCGSPHHFGGPFYMGPIHDQTFVKDLLHNVQTDPERLGTFKRLEGMLSMILEELPDVPFYYLLDQMSSKVKVTMPTLLQFRSAILNGGYRVSMSHCAQNSIKTDAPQEFLWDIFREFAKSSPERKLNDIASRILSQPVTHEINFKEHPEANPKSREKKLVRFQENPQRNWGPKHRARVNLTDNEEDRRKRNQGKKKRKMTTESGSDLIVEIITENTTP